MLKPDEFAEISFPEGATSYRIVECGVNTDVYKSVSANGAELAGTAVEGDYAENRKDFSIANDTTENRARVTYTNEVNPEALRTLSIKKILYKEDGVTEIPAGQDGAEFNFRLSLATEFSQLSAAVMHTYHVKDSNGYYCKWDTAQQKFISLEKDNYDSLTKEEKASASFETSNSGAISKIPATYTVEIRNLLAGTQFGVVERPAEIPDRYSFQKYQYNKENYDGNTTDAMTGVTDVIVANKDPNVDVCNLKGWGLRVNKVWSDEKYMSDRAATYFAVYVGVGTENLTMLSDSVRQLKYEANP